MKHLFDSWDSFVSGVKDAPHVLLLSDYDGTLTPIASRPEEAVLSPMVRNKLLVLSKRASFSIGIISGRSLAEIKDMVGLEGIYYAGNHGLEIEGPGLSFVSPEAREAQAVMIDLAGKLSARLGGIKGIIVEDKGLSLSVHYRLVGDGDIQRVADIFQEVTSPLVEKGQVRVTSGKKVWEVRPPIDWHKGKAVEAVVQELEALHKLGRLLTVYLGDDTTDEDAFKVIRHTRGWSIFVGGENSASSAGYFLNSTSEVDGFLSRLIELK